MKPPAGVVLVFIDEKGSPIANVADFNRTGYGGCTLVESQMSRARRALAMKVCQAYSSDQLVRAIEPMAAEQIVQRLIHEHGCRIHEITIEAEPSKGRV